MNQITKNLMKSFLASYEIPETSEAEDFEKFTAFSILRKACGKDFDVDDILVGDGNDTGIDAIAITVNGCIIEDKEQIDNILEKCSIFDVSYYIIQAKTSTKFKTDEIGTFCRGVEDLFLKNFDFIQNSYVQEKAELHRYLISKADKFLDNPRCYFYYVTNGCWSDDLKDHKNILKKTKRTLLESSQFSVVEYFAYGADEINKLYKSITKENEVQVYFDSKIVLPDIPKIKSAYIGVLKVSEFIKLVLDKNDNIRNVFEDNVRDFQEIRNTVNKEIDKTIEGKNRSLFPLLNNGVTIVAEKIKQTGNNFTLSNYQIVNGCQTSHIIARNYIKQRKRNLIIPVKIIETEDEKSKSSITIATNSQTQIRRDQLIVLSEFQRKLEDFYCSCEAKPKLYYERRSNQYAALDNVPKSRVISVACQIKAFAAMFLRLPHLVSSYYGDLVQSRCFTEKGNNSDVSIFRDDHQPLTYYLSALAFYRLDLMLKNSKLDVSLKKARYFMLLALTVSVIKEKLTDYQLINEKMNLEVLKPLKELLENQDRCNTMFSEIGEKLKKDILSDPSKEKLKNTITTQSIIDLFSEKTYT